METEKNFFFRLMDSKDDMSSKRFTGMTVFFLTIIYIFIYILILNHQSQIVKGVLVLKDIPSNIMTVLITILYISAGLIGLGVLDKLKVMQ